MNFIKELRRRNVIRMAGLYLVGAWLIVQVAGTVLPMFGAPEWIARSVVVLLAIGFVPALMVAWIFELTPQGLKRDDEVSASDSIAPQTAQRMNRLLLAVSALAIGYFAFDKFALAPRREAALVVATKAAAEERRPSGHAIPDIAKDPSIAVLPFVNMSSDKEQDYFSDGISEELLNLLSKVPKLRVIARTSSFSFKGRNVAIPDIARALNVAAILEGSVRKSGDTVRITVQLIRAADGAHLWSETFDRKLDDIFKVQDEIAAAVVDKLRITLLGATPTAKAVDPEAYAVYLRAREESRKHTKASFQQSIALYQQAVALDPGFVAAWEGMAGNYLFQVNEGLQIPDEGTGLARAAIAKAQALEPNSASAHAWLGWIAIYYDRDYAAAARHLERALTLDPANTQVLATAASFFRRLGRMDPAIALGQYLVARDPLNSDTLYELALAYRYAGRLDEAVATFRSVVQVTPEYASAYERMGEILLQQGDAVAALKEIERDTDEDNRGPGLAMTYHALGRKPESDAALSRHISGFAKTSAVAIARAFAYRGEPDLAFEWLGRAIEQKEPGLGSVAVHPALVSLHADPRWLPLLRRLGLAPEQLAPIQFKVTLPELGEVK